jgi:hypothetical protein
MREREDGKHMSFQELMECDIFALMDSEMRIYQKHQEKNQVSAEAAFDLL